MTFGSYREKPQNVSYNKHLDRVEEVKDGDMYIGHPIGLLVKVTKNKLFRFSHDSGGSVQAKPVEQVMLPALCPSLSWTSLDHMGTWVKRQGLRRALVAPRLPEPDSVLLASAWLSHMHGGRA